MRIRPIARIVTVAAILVVTAAPAFSDISYLCVDVPAMHSNNPAVGSTPPMRPCIPWIGGP